MSQMPPTPMQPGYQGPMPGANKPAGMAVAAMVLGIISMVLFCFWYVAIPCAIVAIVLGFVAKGRVARGEGGGSGMATTGLVLGIIAIGLAILVIILALVGLSMFGSKVNEIQKELERQQKLHQQGQSMLSAMFEHVSALSNILGSLVRR